MCTCHHKHLLAATLMALDMERDDVIDVHTAHDRICSIFDGVCCNCEPRLTLQTKGGRLVIDEDGELHASCLN